MLKSLFISSVFTLSFHVFAEELSKVDSEALDKTMGLLKDKSERQEVIDENPDAKKTDDMVKNLLGEGQEMEQAYAAAAEIFRKMASENKGDVGGMMKQLQDAQKDPESFYNSLNEDQKKMIQNLGKSAERRNEQNKPWIETQLNLHFGVKGIPQAIT